MTAQLTSKETRMLYCAVLFFIIAAVSAFFGFFAGISAGAAVIAIALFVLFAMLSFIALVTALVGPAMGVQDHTHPRDPDGPG